MHCIIYVFNDVILKCVCDRLLFISYLNRWCRHQWRRRWRRRRRRQRYHKISVTYLYQTPSTTVSLPINYSTVNWFGISHCETNRCRSLTRSHFILLSLRHHFVDSCWIHFIIRRAFAHDLRSPKNLMLC